jgi:uncharacterized protein YwqG
MAMDDQKFAELLQNAGLGDYVEAILRYKKPCIRLHARLADDPDALTIGSSRIGGLPDLPPNMTWPVRNGRLCEFIAQINLSETSRYDEMGLLPKEGILFFFYDGREYEDVHYQPFQKGRETIFYYSGDINSLQRAADFPDQLDDFQRYRTCSITFERDWMLPNSGNPAIQALERELFGRVGVYDPPAPLAEVYRKLAHDLEPRKDHDKHHLLGYAEPAIQDDPLFTIPGAWDGQKIDHRIIGEWIQLLQISSDDGPGMLWADISSVYYCIRKDDLIARHFDDAICIMENL